MWNTSRTIVAALSAAVVVLGAVPAHAATTTVNSLSVNGWFGGNEGPSGSVGAVAFVPGPPTAPLGTGSVQLTVDANGRASFGTAAYKGTRLDKITALQYQVNVQSFGGAEAPTLQFDVDYDSTDGITTYQGRLVTYSATPLSINSWYSVNALAGTWWATGAPGNAHCTQATPCTMAQVLSLFPQAAIRNDAAQGGNVLFRLGGPVAGGGRVNVDAFQITTNTGSSIYDFEPGVAVNPSVAQPGTVVTITAFGFKPQSTVKSFYVTGGTTGKKVLLCSGTSGEDGTFYCSVPLPTGTLAGPAGTHNIEIQGKNRVRYGTQVFITP
jgi:hypothetical protein